MDYLKNILWNDVIGPLFSLGEAAEPLFLKLLNMGITASYVIAAVLLIRMFLKKAPRRFSFVLWFAVLFRLLCPVSVPMSVSLFNLLPFDTGQTTMEYIPMNIETQPYPAVNTGISALNQVVNSILPAPDPVASINPLQILLPILSVLWIAGICGFILYTVLSLRRLRRIMRTATEDTHGVFLCAGNVSPFAVGIFSKGLAGTGFLKGRIYLPSDLQEPQRSVVLSHERMHLRLAHPLIKNIFYAALVIHWYNPLVWLAFFTMRKDMEMVCDEAVLQSWERSKPMSDGKKKDAAMYSEVLLNMARAKANQEKGAVAGPLAFGESSIAARIKNALRYHGISYRRGLVLTVLCALLLTSCVTNPAGNSPSLVTRLKYHWNTLTGSSKDQIDVLWEHRTAYIGDNSAVGNLLGALSVPAELSLTSDGMELVTHERPYTLIIRYRCEDETEESFLEKDREWIYKNAAVLFALIDNTDLILTRFTLSDGTVLLYPATRVSVAKDLGGEMPVLNSREELEAFMNQAASVTYYKGISFIRGEEPYTMTASVVSNEGVLLVQCEDIEQNEREGSALYFISADRCPVLDESGHDLTGEDLRPDDRLFITYDGLIGETFPMQLPGTICIRRLTE